MCVSKRNVHTKLDVYFFIDDLYISPLIFTRDNI